MSSATCPDPVQGVQVGGSQQPWPPQNAQGQLLCPLLPALHAKPPHSSLFAGAAPSPFFFPTAGGFCQWRVCCSPLLASTDVCAQVQGKTSLSGCQTPSSAGRGKEGDGFQVKIIFGSASCPWAWLQRVYDSVRLCWSFHPNEEQTIALNSFKVQFSPLYIHGLMRAGLAPCCCAFCKPRCTPFSLCHLKHSSPYIWKEGRIKHPRPAKHTREFLLQDQVQDADTVPAADSSWEMQADQ